MIDRVARKGATAVASGEVPNADTGNKATLYGVLAKSLDVDALKGVQLPLAESFTALEESAGTVLKGIAVDAYYSLDRGDRQMAEELFVKRDPRAKAMGKMLGGLSVYGSTRVALGALTAANRETITLRTVARETHEGVTITERGIQLSSRVPQKLALLHLYDLNDERTYHEEWQTPQLDVGDVFKREAVVLDGDHGLKLLVHPELDDLDMRNSHGPQIGCPASMVRGYIQGVHNLMADAALNSGLVAVS
jgi:hypothetical protein